jgi:hydrogenase-4 membrane subunit HyfE
MLPLLHIIQAVGLLTCFALLATSRIGACIRWLSCQGTVFGLVPLILHDDGLIPRIVLLSAANIALKGVVFPLLLLRIRLVPISTVRSTRLSAISPRSCSASSRSGSLFG